MILYLYVYELFRDISGLVIKPLVRQTSAGSQISVLINECIKQIYENYNK